MGYKYLLEKSKRLVTDKSILNGALFSLFSFINRGFSFLLLIILGTYIAPTEYGYLSLFGTVVMVIGYFIAMSTEGYMSISYFQNGKVGIQQSFSAVLFTSSCVFALLGLVVYWGGSKISIYVDLSSSILYMSIGICYFTLFNNLILDYFRIHEKVGQYGLISCGSALLNFILSVLFVKTLLLSWEGRVYAQLLCSIIFGSFGLFYFFYHGYFTRKFFTSLKLMLAWGIPLIPHLATTFIRQGSDRYIINYYHEVSDVGLFSFALNLSNLILMVGIGFNQTNSVDIFKILGSEDLTSKEKLLLLSKQKYTIFWVYVFATIFIIISCLLFIPFLLPKYTTSLPYFVILSLYCFLQCVYFLYTNFLFYYKRTRFIMFVTFFSSLVHLTLSLLLTPYSLYLTCVVYVLTQGLVVFLIRKNALLLLNSYLK